MLASLGLTPLDIVTRTGLHPVPLAVIVLGAGAYAAGVRRLAHTGRRWPPLRSASFVLAVVVLLLATVSGLAAYADTAFRVTAVCQLGLFMVAPAALALSAPLTLLVDALEAGPHPSGGAALRRALTGWPGRVVSFPVLTWGVFAAVVCMAYLTHEYAWAVAHTGGITLLDGELFAVGCLWTWPLLGDDPRPATLGIGWKVLYSLFGVVFYSVVGLAIQSQNRPIAPALAIADFHTGAGVLWSVGSLWSITLAIGVVVQWLMVDEGHALRADRSNAEEDARQLAIWRAERRAAGMADLRARGSVVVGSRPAGTPRADASARSARRSRRQ